MMDAPRHLDNNVEQSQADRKQFLLHMYDQMFNDINTHIIVVWQSVGTLVGAVALFALVEKEILPLDLASTVFVFVCGWLIAHLYDASYWYNRNLAIIANIERQFLVQDDLRHIHYYFGKHRAGPKMLTHLRIQRFLGVGMWVLFLLYHATSTLTLSVSLPSTTEAYFAYVPYLATVVLVVYLSHLGKSRMTGYNEFLKNSPGLQINTEGVEYGPGHPIA